MQPAESMTKLQAGKAAADARLAALMAELQALKQATADAEAKSRADRKVSTYQGVLVQIVVFGLQQHYNTAPIYQLAHEHRLYWSPPACMTYVHCMLDI